MKLNNILLIEQPLLFILMFLLLVHDLTLLLFLNKESRKMIPNWSVKVITAVFKCTSLFRYIVRNDVAKVQMDVARVYVSEEVSSSIFVSPSEREAEGEGEVPSNYLFLDIFQIEEEDEYEFE